MIVPVLLRVAAAVTAVSASFFLGAYSSFFFSFGSGAFVLSFSLLFVASSAFF